MHPRPSSWLDADISETEFAYLGGLLLALAIALTAMIILCARRCARGAGGGLEGGLGGTRGRRARRDLEAPARADEYDILRVLVVARQREAELEVQTDSWDSYEELRELVVNSVPEMFRDTDELVLEYMNAQSRWMRVKMRTLWVRKGPGGGIDNGSCRWS